MKLCDICNVEPQIMQDLQSWFRVRTGDYKSLLSVPRNYKFRRAVRGCAVRYLQCRTSDSAGFVILLTCPFW